MIFLSDIENMIDKLSRAGADVFNGDFAIYAAPGILFYESVYPLEVIVSSDLPDRVVCIIAKKPEHSGLQLRPPVKVRGIK